MAPNNLAPVTPSEVEPLKKVADAFGVKIVADDAAVTTKVHAQRRPFNPVFPAAVPVTPYEMECAIAKAPSEEFLIAMLSAAVRMKHVPYHTKRRWSNVAEKRIVELRAAPPQFTRLSPSEAFPEVRDERPAMKPSDIVGAVNGNREMFCVENGVFKFVGPNDKPITIHEYFNGEAVELPTAEPSCDPLVVEPVRVPSP